jgi:hypothetical protein
MKRRHLLLIAIVILILTAGIIINKNSSTSDQICIEESCFHVEVADTDAKKILGLSNRDSLSADSGMLFPYPEGAIPGFWMKDMRFPIDIIWINSEMKISGIVNDFQPCLDSYSCLPVYPEEEIIYVLEINSGLSEYYGFEAGNSVLII